LTLHTTHNIEILLSMLERGPSADLCDALEDCYLALAPLCALNATFSQPVPINSPSLIRAVDFLDCDVSYTAGLGGRVEEATKACAKKAGIPWEGPNGMRECMGGSAGFEDLVGHMPCEMQRASLL